jgi:hypothetical protein
LPSEIGLIPILFGTIDIHIAASAGTNGQCEGNGAFFLNRGVRFAEITDGLSNTLIIGERSCREVVPSHAGRPGMPRLLD